eukprot:NODE_16_length_49026_cov_1.035992.p10 type:complete len:354 gc:universal NODE_16_length_49026_cov_1.035992:34745-33684(-)
MLDISWKNIEEIPLSSIESNVQDLSLSNNIITQIPQTFTTLSCLQTLDLSNNAIVALPAMPKTLKILNLSGNRLTDVVLNEMISKSSKVSWNLEKLWLANNEIKNFPMEITKLINLDLLSLAGNKIKEIPTQIKSLEKLRFFGLSDNLLTDAEVILLLLPQLQGVGISGNPLKDSEIQIHRMRHKMRVLRVGNDKPIEEVPKDNVAETLEVQLSRKGTKLLKKKGQQRRPMTLAGLPSFQENAEKNEEPIRTHDGILEEDAEAQAGSSKKFSPQFTSVQMTSSLSVFDFRDNIDELVDSYFDDYDNEEEEQENPHRVQLSKRYSRLIADDKKKTLKLRSSKSEAGLSENSSLF